VDAGTTALAGNPVTLNAADYDLRTHNITFNGSKDEVPFSQIVPFKVEEGDEPVPPVASADTFVAIGGNRVAYSSDGGRTWVPSTLPQLSDGYWYNVGYGAGTFVAVAGIANGGTDMAAYSIDGGRTWTEITLPISKDWDGVTYGAGKFIIYSDTDAVAVCSIDGVHWTETNILNNRAVVMAYGAGKFVSLSPWYEGAYSSDGVNWTKTTTPVFGDWQGITYGAGKFIAVGGNANANGGPRAVYSTDGINWTTTELPTLDGSYWWDHVAYGDGAFVAIAVNPGGYPQRNEAAYSSDGFNWTVTTLPDTYWCDIAYGNGVFVTVSQQNTAAYSTDGGKTWTATTVPNVGSGYWYNMASGYDED
jgi:hypothetical protein